MKSEYNRGDHVARSKKNYVIKVHYPETDEGLIMLRKQMGKAYMEFSKDYILTLPISNHKKNNLYSQILERCIKNNPKYEQIFARLLNC